MAQNERTTKGPVVVIIGAGFSGLAAAKTLCDHGQCDVIVLEALDRIGGRIHSQKFNSRHVELGAQWLHGERGNPLYEIAVTNDLLDEEYLYETNLRAQYFTQDGRRIPHRLVQQVDGVINDLHLDANKFFRSKVPIDPKIRSVGAFFRDGFERHLLKQKDSKPVLAIKEALFKSCILAENIENGCDSMYDLSLEAWGEYSELEGNEEVNIRDGFGSIVEVVRASIPDHVIRLKTPVKSIRWPLTDERTKVVCDDYEIEADHVIVTSSVGFLKQAQDFFEPKLPCDKLDAISSIGFGVVDKLIMEFEEPFWHKDLDGINMVWLDDDDTFTLEANKGLKFDEPEDEFWYRDILCFDTLNNQPNVLLGWICGRGARVMETLSLDTVRDACVELLQKFTRNLDILKPNSFLRTKWNSNPYICGAYCYVSTSGTTRDFAELAKPLPNDQNPRLLFAGEGTHQNYFSTAHAAYISGIREAQRIIDFHASQSPEL